MPVLEKEITEFAEQIKKTETYRNYVIQKDRIKAYPGLKEKIDEFRRKNFILQNSEAEDLLEKTEAFSAEYAAFRREPMVDAFLEAELQFCRMIQDIYTEITEKLDFE